MLFEQPVDPAPPMRGLDFEGCPLVGTAPIGFRLASKYRLISSFGLSALVSERSWFLLDPTETPFSRVKEERGNPRDDKPLSLVCPPRVSEPMLAQALIS